MSRRVVRGGTVVLNGRPLARETIQPFAMPISANSPCKVVPPASAMVRAAPDGRQTCLYPAFRETLPGGPGYTVLDQIDSPRADDFPTVTVPAGQLFLMGDNRDDSLDSRATVAEQGVGFVPMDHVVGRAGIGFFSTDGTANLVKPWTWVQAARWDRIGATY